MHDDLIEELAQFADDPLGFVYFAFPWGETGELFERVGPEPWQVQVLEWLGAGVITPAEAVQIAVTSGHGIGKSALVAWIILWALSTFEDTRGVVTANTENQLKTKTWVELAKWYRLFIGRELFSITATAIFSRDPEHERTWRIDMTPWSERNTEAFAGLHNQGRRVLVLFDEASAIPDVIWEVTEGALTDRDTQIIWCCFGNPTRNKGRFRDCFDEGRFAHRWRTMSVDSRHVSLTDKDQIQRWIDDYGEDNDFVRIRVRGMFPRTDSVSFISYDLARGAQNRVFNGEASGPIILGVDVARFGDDASVIYPRCGYDARSYPVEVYRGIDTMTFAARIAAAFLRHRASAIMVDSGGVGGGVVDRLRMLRLPVLEVDFGSRSDGHPLVNGENYGNKRAEIWGAMREWLKTGLIPDISVGGDRTLVDELCGPGFHLNNKDRIMLEGKRDMVRRGEPSPNVADALACTFAWPHVEAVRALPGGERPQPTIAPDWDPFTRQAIYH